MNGEVFGEFTAMVVYIRYPLFVDRDPSDSETEVTSKLT